jgi:predicted esterase
MMGAVEHHLEVARTARYWVLGEDAAAPREAWFVLHGYRQLARRFLHRFECLDDGTRLIVAPEALSRFYTGTEAGRHGPTSAVGATWMTREDRLREIDDYVRYLDRLSQVVLADAGDDLRVAVLGFSQGVATAARWTALGAVRAHRLVLWGDFLPPDLDGDKAAAAWARTDVVLVRGDADRAFADRALLEAERVRLEAWGVRLRVHRYAGGHDIPPAVLAEVAAAGPTPRAG